MTVAKRFWINTRGVEDRDDVTGWYAVVDEDRGGIVAYFGRREDALAYIDLLFACVKMAGEWRRDKESR